MTRNEFVAQAAIEFCSQSKLATVRFKNGVLDGIVLANALEEKGVAPWGEKCGYKHRSNCDCPSTNPSTCP